MVLNELLVLALINILCSDPFSFIELYFEKLIFIARTKNVNRLIFFVFLMINPS